MSVHVCGHMLRAYLLSLHRIYIGVNMVPVRYKVSHENANRQSYRHIDT
jgi:hypothetical protein